MPDIRHSIGGIHGVPGFTPLQRFFLAYTYARMGHERLGSLATRLRGGGGYAPARERVNGVVMNIPEFYGCFDVQTEDLTYGPKRTRAEVY